MFSMNKVIACLIVLVTVTGCGDPFDIDINVPPLPCFDGWQYDYAGQPIVNPETGAQVRCDNS